MFHSPGHGEVMLGADEPPEVTIEMHLEMSYNRDMPARIYFYCLKVYPCSTTLQFLSTVVLRPHQWRMAGQSLSAT